MAEGPTYYNPPVPFKQNLPAVVVVASLAAFGALFLLLQPAEEDRLRRAVNDHIKTVPKAQSVEIAGTVAEIRTSDGLLLFHAFARGDDGRWRFLSDLKEDFERTLRDPAVSREIATRLGQRLQERFQKDIGVHEGLDYQFAVLREADGVVGQIALTFAYGKPGDDPRPRGLYRERFRWDGARWQSLGGGSLYDAAPR